MQRENVAFRVNNAAFYRSLIKEHPLFAGWPNEVLSQFSKLWNVVTFETGKNIVSEGMPVDNIYFIVEGNCEVITHDKADPTKIHTLAVLSPGESIGLSPTGLFSETSERTASVIALSKTLAITIKLKTLQTFLHQHPNLSSALEESVDRVFKMQLAKESVPFARLSSAKLRELADKIDIVDVPAQKILFHEGDAADVCYLIAKGKVEISKKNEKNKPMVLAILSTPSIFGEMAIVMNTTRNASATTLSACKLFRLQRDDLLKLFAAEKAVAKRISGIIIKRSRPERIANVVERHETTPDKTKRIVLKNIRNKELYKLNEKSFFAWSLMDGTNSIEDINNAMMKKYGEDATEDLVLLISDLAENGFIEIHGYRFRSKSRKTIWQRVAGAFKG